MRHHFYVDGGTYLLIRPFRQLPMQRQRFRKLRNRRVVLRPVAVVVHEALRRRRIVSELGWVSQLPRRVYHVPPTLIIDEVVAATIPVALANLATWRAVGWLRRGRRRRVRGRRRSVSSSSSSGRRRVVMVVLGPRGVRRGWLFVRGISRRGLRSRSIHSRRLGTTRTVVMV